LSQLLIAGYTRISRIVRIQSDDAPWFVTIFDVRAYDAMSSSREIARPERGTHAAEIIEPRLKYNSICSFAEAEASWSDNELAFSVNFVTPCSIGVATGSD
jgi:hypothetical protein